MNAQLFLGELHFYTLILIFRKFCHTLVRRLSTYYFREPFLVWLHCIMYQDLYLLFFYILQVCILIELIFYYRRGAIYIFNVHSPSFFVRWFKGFSSSFSIPNSGYNMSACKSTHGHKLLVAHSSSCNTLQPSPVGYGRQASHPLQKTHCET